MLQKNSQIFIIDNSDAQKVKCIHKYKKKRLRKNSNIGSILLSSIKKRLQRKDLIKSKINKILVAGVKKKTRRRSGEFFSSYKNKAILLDGKFQLLGSRIKNTLPKELKTFTSVTKKAKKLF